MAQLQLMNSCLEEQDKEIKALREKLTTEESEEKDTPPPPPPPSPRQIWGSKTRAIDPIISCTRGSGSWPWHHCRELREKLPKKAALGDLPKFKGFQDPDDHLRAFSIFMDLKGMSKYLLAYVFPSTSTKIKSPSLTYRRKMPHKWLTCQLKRTEFYWWSINCSLCM